MAKYRKILVAYDGSTSAKSALSLASHLAREDKSWIKVLAVVPSYEGDLELTWVSNIKDTLLGPGRKLLAEASKIAEAEDVHILTDIEQGEPYEQIVHVADDENCDLIVMGRRGLSHLTRELMGGVTARVIGHTSRDVLVVPEHRGLDWNNILLATDGSIYSEAAIARAIALAKDRNAKLTAVSVVYTNDEFYALAQDTVVKLVNETREVLEKVAKQAEEADVDVEMAVKEGEPYQAIADLATQMAADLIVMGSHGRKGLTRLLMGSVTERVIGFAPCPVLISHVHNP